jgi:hypothetical protein
MRTTTKKTKWQVELFGFQTAFGVGVGIWELNNSKPTAATKNAYCNYNEQRTTTTTNDNNSQRVRGPKDQHQHRPCSCPSSTMT